MQPRVTQAVKTTVIEDWLRGLSRDTIAAKHGLSAGTVTNTIRKWRLGLDEAVADELREFALALRKLRITAPRCAEGARASSMMTNLGIDENDFYSFMSETYDHCIKSGLQPERIAHNLKQMLDLSESVPFGNKYLTILSNRYAEKTGARTRDTKTGREASEARRRLLNALEEENGENHGIAQFILQFHSRSKKTPNTDGRFTSVCKHDQ